MNILSITNPIQSVFSLLSKSPSVSAATRTASTGLGGPADTSSVTTLGQLWHNLSSLRTSNPQAFSTFAQNAATELKAAAANQPAGDTKDFLSKLGGVLQNAATNPGSPLQFPHSGNGQYIPKDHPVAEDMMQMLTQQSAAMLQTGPPVGL